MKKHPDEILVLDFGSQYSHLIVRRIRELGVYAELVPCDLPLDRLREVKGIILSGGPQNLSEKSALRIDKGVFKMGIPILGICYGLQLTAYELGGKIKAAKTREYGPTVVSVKGKDLFTGLSKKQMTWMSHGDHVSRVPQGFKITASSSACPVVAMADEKRKIYGLQFHPEVSHTTNGIKVLNNFLKITGAKRSWSMKDYLNGQINKVKQTIGKDKAVCALSGGVDSAVAAAIVNRAIGKNLTCIYVDTGLMRKGETAEVIKAFKQSARMNLRVIDARGEFLRKLSGVIDPEKKRKIIGELFIRIFEREAKKIYHSPPARGGVRGGGSQWLVQGTLYTDAISSGVSVGKTAAVIKSHHNVGGLPEKFGFKLVEPLRELYKDEVRKIGKLLKLPDNIVYRQPFPGPGLAVRIIGEVTAEKLEILKEADSILREEIKKSGQDKKIQQYFAVLPGIRSVGVQGDSRTYGHPIILRAVTTKDFMTAHWAQIPYEVLERISVRITNEVKDINRVVYDITSKPPGTVEWE